MLKKSMKYKNIFVFIYHIRCTVEFYVISLIERNIKFFFNDDSRDTFLFEKKI